MGRSAATSLFLLLVAFGWGHPSAGETLERPAGAASPHAQGAGQRERVMKSERREVGPFTAIEARGAHEIRITCQEPLSLEVRADEDALPWISTEVRDRTLVLDTVRGALVPRAAQVFVSVPELEAVVLSGSGSVRLLDATGAKLEIILSGSGEIRAEGETGVLTARLSGSGSLDLRLLRARTVSITLSGSGDAQVHAAEELRAELSGSGDVVYYGGPKEVHRRVTGSGTVSAGE
jgi:hypothetical protein